MAGPSSGPNPGAQRLLELREKQGTQFSLVFSLVLMLLFVAVVFASAQSLFELLVTLAIIAASCLAPILLLWQVSQNRLVGFAGWTLTTLYLLVMLAMPWIWYQSVGGNPVPKTYLLKINIMPLMFICMVLTALPGRPWFPLFYTLGSTAGLLALYTYALLDPTTIIVDKILDSTMGPGASLGLLFNNLVLYLASGLLLSVFLRRFQQTVVQAALSMQKRLTVLNETLASRGFPVLKQGIGIHCGPVIAGNVGTVARLEYTVIGDAVNTASRLESLCKETGDALLVSDAVAGQVREPLSAQGLLLVSRGNLTVKGRSQPVEAFTVSSGSD